uniref:Uncharacterized protein n=1 Tax=uncultured gamma proteobacterium HF4000_48E10 TaxID=723583 RepID=E7C8R5_9GAMM|nr:hypothetical protein [uncultured gamma proteobacterium HF4000_48E10]
MLSLERCRKILGDDASLADEDLERLRRDLYALAHVAVSAFVTASAGDRQDSLKAALRLVPTNAQEALEERAAIREYDGGLDRDDAERAVLSDYVRDASSR